MEFLGSPVLTNVLLVIVVLLLAFTASPNVQRVTLVDDRMP